MASSSVPKYKVFLSSSSKDAGNFSYLLHKGLEDKGILTLRGNQEVEGGGTASLDVIRQSRLAIVIVSPDYASSPRLLQQLVQILQANKLHVMQVLPVFHLVNPSDVRHQRGTIGESLKKHVQYQVEEINGWRQALTTVANLSGWNTGDFKDQTRLIKAIEEYVLERVRVPRRGSIIRKILFSSEEKEQIIEQPVDEVTSNISVEEEIEQPGDDVTSNISNITAEEEIIEQPVDEVSSNSSVEEIIEQPVDEVSSNSSVEEEIIEQHVDEEEIIEQPVAEVTGNTSVKEEIKQPVDVVAGNTCSVKEKIISIGVDGHINKHEEQKGTAHATTSAEWKFLLCTLGLEIFSAGFDQASSPSKPHYALIGMLLAVAAVFSCIWELIHKKSLVLKSWQKLRIIYIYYPRPSNTFFESHLDIYAVVSSTSQCVFSTVQYIYFFHHADSPIRLSVLPALYLICLVGSRLCKNRWSEKLPS